MMARHGKHAHTPHDATRRGQERGAPGSEAATSTLSAAQEAEVARLLTTIPALAQDLLAAANDGRDAIAARLMPIESADAAVRLAFAARLGEIRGPEARQAVEVAHALGEVGRDREVAREARRARIRLRSAGVLPTLDLAPAPASPTPTVDVVQKPRLVEAVATRTRQEGELSVATAWQEGDDPDIVRGCMLLLDFWHDGVKGFTLTAPMTIRRFHSDVVGSLQSETQAHIAPVSWAFARRLVQEALDVNAWRGTQPDSDYRINEKWLSARLLNVPESEEARAAVTAEDERFAREGDRPLVADDLDPDELILNWLGMWSFGDFGGAYDLLAAEHPIRREMSREDYIASRRKWFDEAQPASMRVTLIREQEQRASALWVPGAAGPATPGRGRDFEAFWSLNLKDSPLGGTLSELPIASIVSRETGRHWYWTGYTVAKDSATGVWMLSRTRDEGAASQALTIEELQKRIADAHASARSVMETAPQQLSGDEAQEALRKLTGALTVAIQYRDALSVRLPLDETIYRDSLEDARTIRADERAAAILEQMESRFPGRARTSFELGGEYYLVSTQVAQQGDIAAQRVWQERAIRALRKAVELEPTAEHLQGLGEILVESGHYGQAIEILREALRVQPDRASVHSDLADAIMSAATGEDLDSVDITLEDAGDDAERERLRQAGHEALAELREAQRLDPNVPNMLSRIGSIYQVLGQPEDALIAFQDAVRHDPQDAQAHYTLGSLYMDRSEPQKAVVELERAAELAPLQLAARIGLAAAYAVLRRWKDAERELDFVDRVRPGMPQVADLRAQIARLQKA
jgi:tetratricopeptide (TPR) repeat protein